MIRQNVQRLLHRYLDSVKSLVHSLWEWADDDDDGALTQTRMINLQCNVINGGDNSSTGSP